MVVVGSGSGSGSISGSGVVVHIVVVVVIVVAVVIVVVVAVFCSCPPFLSLLSLTLFIYSMINNRFPATDKLVSLNVSWHLGYPRSATYLADGRAVKGSPLPSAQDGVWRATEIFEILNPN